MTIDPNSFFQICKSGQESLLTKTNNYALLKPFDHQAVGSIVTFVPIITQTIVNHHKSHEKSTKFC